MSRIAILGAGAWGTALTLSLDRLHAHQLTLWAHSATHADDLTRTRDNTRYLPGFPLSPNIRITADLIDAVTDAEVILCVTPSEHLRAIIHRIAPHLTPAQALISASKGIEDHTFLRMSQVIEQTIAEHSRTNPIGALSGPSFAQEVAAGLPTVVAISSTNTALAQTIQSAFSQPSLRLYTNDDIIGVELGGALKNVIALAAGVCVGLNLGSNIAAALITRGLAEITRLAIACGGRRETIAGLSGMGDLVLTCTGSLSRNRTVGIELGRGRKLPDILADLQGKVAEGVRSTTAALGLAAKYGVEMPITEQMSAILHQHKPAIEAVHDLMVRPGKVE